MGELVIQTVTVSVEVADKEYGKGDGRNMHLKGWYQDGGVSIDRIDEVVLDSMDMFLGAWKAILCSRYAQDNMTADEFKQRFERAMLKVDKVKKFLKRQNEDDTGDSSGIQSGETS